MGPEAWARKLGDSAWLHMRGRLPAGKLGDTALAEILTAAVEAGFVAPERAPTVSATGTRVLWPRVDGGTYAALTGAGLAAQWAHQGHGFLLLRAAQLAHGCAGPLLARLQEVLAAYEEQCRADEVPALPTWADIRPFVGGSSDEAPVDWDAIEEGLFTESPKPGPRAVARAR